MEKTFNVDNFLASDLRLILQHFAVEFSEKRGWSGTEFTVTTDPVTLDSIAVAWEEDQVERQAYSF
jgi:hypothetical protein